MEDNYWFEIRKDKAQPCDSAQNRIINGPVLCRDKLSHWDERIDFKQINCVTLCEGFDKQFNWGGKTTIFLTLSISFSSRPRAVFPLPDLWKQLLCIRPCTARLPRHAGVGRTHWLGNLINGGTCLHSRCLCWNWDYQSLLAVQLPFRERKMGLPVKMYLPARTEAQII